MYKFNRILQWVSNHSSDLLLLIYIIFGIFHITNSPYFAEVTGIGTILAAIVCYCKIYSAKQNNTAWSAIKQSKFVIYFTIGMLILWLLSLNLSAQ